MAEAVLEAKPPVEQEKKDEAAKTDEGGEIKKAPKKKIKRSVKHGAVYVLAGFNNTLLTATDPSGNVIARTSAGASGFKGTKKSTPYAAHVASEKLAEKLKLFDMQTMNVYVKGIGPGREQSVRGLAKNFEIQLIIDQTSLPHNGCRAKKRRRV